MPLQRALTASIAHEVNQPLSGIITNATTCLDMLGDDPPDLEGARITVQHTLRDGNRASEVIKRLRDRPRNLLIVTSPEDANHVRLSVCDSGVGIDPKDLDKLFNAFYTTKSQGMGMG